MLLLLLAMVMSPKVSLADVDGKQVEVLPASGRGVVAFFLLSECPIANAYSREMTRIARDYKGWHFYAVYADPSTSAADLKRHHREFGFAFSGVVDTAGSFARLAGATHSPEAAVFSPAGKVLYRGRIDDRYYTLGRQRAAPTSRDLRAALDAINLGKRPPKAITPVVGCIINAS